MHYQLKKRCDTIASTAFEVASFVGEGRFAAVYRLKNGNALKMTCCGPSIDWLIGAQARAGNPYLPNVVKHFGCLYETQLVQLHAFEVEFLTDDSAWAWPAALSRQVDAVGSFISNQNRINTDLCDEAFWQKVVPILDMAICSEDKFLNEALKTMFDMLRKHKGKAYPDFTAAAKRNILKRGEGDFVFMDPVASVFGCKPTTTQN